MRPWFSRIGWLRRRARLCFRGVPRRKARLMLKTSMVVVFLTAAAMLPAYGQSAAPRPAPAAHAGAAAPQALGAGQFPTEQAAKAHCPGDTIVWANLGGSQAYH